MKKMIGIVLFLFGSNVLASGVDELIDEVKSGNLSLAAIAHLELLDKPGNRMGYGLCKAANREGCVLESSIGYGLCMASHREGCISNGSLGYGMCMLSKRNDCVSNGSVGYGICMVAKKNDCIPN